MKFHHALIVAATITALGVTTARADGMPSAAAPAVEQDRCGGGKFHGWYTGVGLGWASADFDAHAVTTHASASGEDDAFAVSWYSGYNRQCGRLVYGFESDLNWADLDPNGDEPGGQTVGTEYEYFSTVRGRFGIAHDNMLFYGTAGLAYAKVENYLDATNIGFGKHDDEEVLWGFTAGGGVELARDHWRFRLEGLYVNLEDTVSRYEFTGPCIDCEAHVSYDNDFYVVRAGIGFSLHREEAAVPLK